MDRNELSCPICRRPVSSANKSFPFCSKRCRWVDMGRWLEGAYRISRDPTRPDQELAEEDAPDPPPSPEDSGD